MDDTNKLSEEAERAAFIAWMASLPTEDRYDFDSEGRGFKKSHGVLMELAWMARAKASTPSAQPPVALPAAAGEPMGSVLQRVMARLADMLDDDKFNNIEAIVNDAGYTAPATSAGMSAERASEGLPEPAWFAVETPGADFDVSFVHTMDDALVLNDGDPDSTSYVTRLYTEDQLRAALAKPAWQGDGEAGVPVGFWLAPIEPDDDMKHMANEAYRLHRLATSADLYRAMRDSWLARHPQTPVHADVERDAARYRWLRSLTVGYRDEAGAKRFRLPNIEAVTDIMRGSVAQHLDAAIDAVWPPSTDAEGGDRG